MHGLAALDGLLRTHAYSTYIIWSPYMQSARCNSSWRSRPMCNSSRGRNAASTNGANGGGFIYSEATVKKYPCTFVGT